MPFQIDPDLIENNDVKITTDGSGNFVLEHVRSGKTLTMADDGTLNADAIDTAGDISDSGNGVTVYDESTQKVTADVNNGSVSTDKVATNRTWDDVTGARAFDTTEANNTGSDIEISCTAQAASDGTRIDIILSIGGQIYCDRFDQNVNANRQATIRGTVPDGQTYKIITFGDSADYSINHFLELKP